MVPILGDHDFKAKIFADDLLLALTQPHKSIPQVKKLMCFREDINRWTVLPISLWGRGEVLKINILPRLLGNPSFYSPLITRYLPGTYMVNHSVLLGNYHW